MGRYWWWRPARYGWAVDSPGRVDLGLPGVADWEEVV